MIFSFYPQSFDFLELPFFLDPAHFATVDLPLRNLGICREVKDFLNSLRERWLVITSSSGGLAEKQTANCSGGLLWGGHALPKTDKPPPPLKKVLVDTLMLPPPSLTQKERQMGGGEGREREN